MIELRWLTAVDYRFCSIREIGREAGEGASSGGEPASNAV